MAVSLEQGHIPCDHSIEARVLIGLGALQAGVKHRQFDFRPSGKAPVLFNSSAVTDSSVVFENPQQGFPQKIGYRRDGERSV